MFHIGPILNRELVGVLRRGRSFWYLLIYLALLCYMTAATWATWSMSAGMDRAMLSRQIFLSCSLIQIGMCGLFGVIISAGQISSERRRKTLDLLLTTPLRHHEVILGKALASVGYLLLLVIAGLPIYSLCFLFGGVSGKELGLTIYLSLLTGITYSMIGVASSTLQSTRRLHEERSGFLIVFLLNGGLALALGWILGYVLKLPSMAVTAVSMETLSTLSPVFLFLVLTSPLRGIAWLFSLSGTGLLLFIHTLAEICLFFLFLWLACRHILRESVAAPAPAEVKGRPKEERRSRLAFARLFPIPDFINPVAAKDILLALPRRKIARVLLAFVGIVLFGLAVWGLIESKPYTPGSNQARQVYDIVALIIIGVSNALVFLRATGAVALEAEAGTLALLDTTPLSARRVMWGKLEAVIATVVGAIAVFAGGLAAVFCMIYPGATVHVLLTLPLAFVAMATGAALYGSLGIRIGATARTVRSANTRAGLFCFLGYFVGLSALTVIAHTIKSLFGHDVMELAGIGLATTLFPPFWVFLSAGDLPGHGHVTVRLFMFLIGTFAALALAWLALRWSAAVYIRRLRKEQEQRAKT